MPQAQNPSVLSSPSVLFGKPTKVYIETLGCAKNRFDSEVMLNSLLSGRYVYESEPQEAEVLILNTCAFLTEAVKESIDATLRFQEYKNKTPTKKIFVVGCMVERFQEELLKEFPEIDGVMGTSDYTKILTLVESALLGEERTSLLPSKPKYLWENYTPRKVLSTDLHYAYLKIAEGCNNQCTFCNIPKLRGKQRSRPACSIQEEFETLLNWGVKEVNLLSQDTSNWGKDFPKPEHLLNLVQNLLKPEKDFWLRILYSYPNDYPLELFSMMKEHPQLVSYVDMPFQHISDKVLKAMNRRITRSKIEKILDHGSQLLPNLAWRTTFIVGFPNETEQDFEELLQFVKLGRITHLGVFCYSDEDNIPSHRLGDPVPKKEKLLRRKLIMQAQQTVSLKKNQNQIGSVQKVLITGLESGKKGYKGRLASQAVDVDGLVFIPNGQAKIGEFKKVLITKAFPYDLEGEFVAS